MIDCKSDLWHLLQKETRPILMYGMGNGADKILGVLERYGVTVSDFFASDGFVRGHAFHGKTVLSYSQAKEKYDDFVVLLSFASALPSVIETVQKVASEHPLFIPDVPVAGENLFDLAFYSAHRAEAEQARSLFSDALSQRLFDRVVHYKLTGDLSALLEDTTTAEEDFSQLLHPNTYRAAADLGAYNGDTASELLSFAPHLTRIYAMEPDERNFRKLNERAQNEGFADRLQAVRAAAWDKEETLTFRQEGNRNAGVGDRLSQAGGKLKTVTALPLDTVLDGAAVDYIKYDVEGAEKEAILGGKETILHHRPELLVSLYHRSEDLFALPLLLHKICPDYRFYLRRRRCLPAWDLNLLAIPIEK